MALDVRAIRRQFPYLERIAENDAVYLDNAATTQTPRSVIMTVSAYMSRLHGNVHRGQHRETEISTTAYETARNIVRHFVNAAHADEIIFTKNATEGINLVMRAWAAAFMKSGDCIVLSKAEHHANIIPWLQLAEFTPGIRVIWIDVDGHGLPDMGQLRKALEEERVKLVALTGQSNVLGTRPDLKPVIRQAHEAGARVLIDAAQLAAHAKIDVQESGCDFLVFSGHKIYGPTGIGVLYASRDAQKEMIPFMGGGGMVQEVTLGSFTPADAPAMFEAGTPPVAEAVGLAAAIEWQAQFSWKDREAHDKQLMRTAMEELQTVDGLRILGMHHAQSSMRNPPFTPHGCIAFTIDGVHPHDLTDILGQKGIAMRAGHHCAQPLHTALSIGASTRLSTALYTTGDEIRQAAAAVKDALGMLL